ncbi:putative signal transduction protein [Sulfurimonas gotlandica GD1]|uniref:Putative signal transduction protein n=1 Tax=Sulfurimonas gotlandica (strain DSM 19862 / JCM 16533 / GD1) TaxID=929558 RepID=B6BK02_SULGG|nr:HDOD domain-containing protein [Sulfurimonas gotlandica]EDZ62622.1 putative signal transduction protein [Sulfurimonas gotlandica GD1]EHP31093.1 putative signal transduction protein [Sulfurimonas gotlandica GD1]
MNFKAIVQRVESLPPLSNATVFVQQLYKEGAENVDIIKLVRIIESDALLTLNILKMINAPIYGFSRKIASVAQAVTLFGTEIIYGLVMNYSIMEALKANTSSYGVTSAEFNDVCHLQSALMLQWYSKVDLRHSQFLAPLALVMEAGKLILVREIEASDYVKDFKNGLKECSSIEVYEHSMFDTTSYYITALLFEHWNLEPLYVDMLKGLDFDNNEGFKMEYYINTLHVVRTAVNVKEVLTDASIEKACLLVEDMDLDSDYFRHVAKRIRAAYEKF